MVRNRISKLEKTALMLGVEGDIGEPIQAYLRREYQTNERSQKDIGEELGVSQTTVMNWLQATRILTRPTNPIKGRKSSTLREIEEWLGEPIGDYLQREYVESQRILEDIAEELGVSKATAGKWLKVEGIETIYGPRKEEGKTALMREVEEWLEEPLENYLKREYEDNKRTYEDISQELEVASPTIRKWIEAFEIEKRERNYNEWADLNHCLETVRKIKREQGLDRMPASDGLRELGYGPLYSAISKVHGGVGAFRELLEEEPMANHGFFSRMTDEQFVRFLNKNYRGMRAIELKGLDNTAYQEILNRKLTDEVNERKIILRSRRGQGAIKHISDQDLVALVEEDYRGYAITELEDEDATVVYELRKRELVDQLVERGTLVRKQKPSGFYKGATDDELIKYAQQYRGKTITQVEKDGGESALILQLRKREIIDRSIEEAGLVRKKRRNNPLNDMNDREFIKYMEQNNKGLTRSEVARRDKTAYREMKRRELDDRLVEEGVLISAEKGERWGTFTKMSDKELVDYFRKNHTGRNPSYFQGGRMRPYNLAKERGLLDKLFEEKILVRVKAGYTTMEDEQFLDYVRENFQGMTSKEIRDVRSGGVWEEARKRSLLDQLVDEGTLVRKHGSKYVPLTDDELISYIRHNFQGASLTELNRRSSAARNEIDRRGLLDYLIDEGVLVRKGYGQNSAPDPMTFVGENETAQAIASLTTVSENTSDIANMLVQMWPDRFPSASQLARSLPSAVRKIGYSLHPFTMEKARGLYEKTRALPAEVRYALDDMLINIAIDQYQARFNEDPEGTLEELKDLSKGKNGIRKLAKKVHDSYREVYTFHIPGHGKLRDVA